MVLVFLSNSGANILTITQNLPVNSKAHVVLTLDVSALNQEISKDRNVFAKVYGIIKSNNHLKANDELDLAHKLAIRDGALSAAQILFSMIVFMELNFIEWDAAINQMQILNAKKVELDKSKFYQEVI